ncbi:hypothetical protein QWI17_19315 [Gilvimarinus sp. SDUM040013]|uniref:Uncharacterized protein n=1 Tax=Gilvimarinus gilvus TaxID=3058038 RepID=A0ABU4S465_9GAMM|nr:hypothetical protein [Gilvimarinus sp. SDUM040013]MDO3388003.1 hypothetical protein [Gilvimarinus sp. SDUM040013]MDX6851216.1 hypothetical protein [Gilvimarinus sp. SDUM040013]
MTQSHWEHSVTEALSKLGKPKWLQPLQQLCEAFEGVSLDGENISSEIELVLWDLVSLNNNSDSLPLERLFQRRLSELECWTHRAFNPSGNPQFWNPLQESFKAFKSGQGSIREYTAANAHPAQDMIRKWAEAHCV